MEGMFCGRYQVLNYGIPGATLLNEGDTPYWNMSDHYRSGFPEAAMALNPQIVLLMLGTNDSKPYNWNKENFTEQLDSRVKEILGSGHAGQLILMCPPFTCPAEGHDVVGYDIINKTIRDEIVPIIKTCAAKNRVQCIDLYALTEFHPEYFADGVHPNSFGNYVIAKYIYDSLVTIQSYPTGGGI